jgi:hypothetical protein
MLTEELCSIGKLTLQGFTQNWIEWFILSTTHVDATASEGDNQL